MRIILLLTILLLSIVIPIISFAENEQEADEVQQLTESELDNSLPAEEYYNLGIPHTLEKIEDYEKIYQVFFDLAEGRNNLLPKYDSPKSQEIFDLVFSHATIDRILSYVSTYQEQQRVLLGYYQVFSHISSLYYSQNVFRVYADEVTRIGVLKLYALLLAYELFDRDLLENKMTLDDMFSNEEEAFVFQVTLYNEYCTVHKLSSKNQKLDPQTQQYISGALSDYNRRIKTLSFVDDNINFTNEFCREIFMKKLEIGTKWSEQ